MTWLETYAMLRTFAEFILPTIFVVGLILFFVIGKLTKRL